METFLEKIKRISQENKKSLPLVKMAIEDAAFLGMNDIVFSPRLSEEVVYVLKTEKFTHEYISQGGFSKSLVSW